MQIHLYIHILLTTHFYIEYMYISPVLGQREELLRLKSLTAKLTRQNEGLLERARDALGLGGATLRPKPWENQLEMARFCRAILHVGWQLNHGCHQEI